MSIQGILHSSRATRAAVATIGPMIGYSRKNMGGIPAQAWGRPYIIGFISTLITLIAVQKTKGRLQGEQLGTTQVNAWMAITGMQDAQIGEDICLLSTNSDADFMCGCQNATRFIASYHGLPAYDGTDLDEILSSCNMNSDDFTTQDLAAFGKGGALVAALWTRYFETHII